MLKIRNREPGEVVYLGRDVCVTHPEWVHKQCGTSSEAELQRMLDQYSYDEFARHAESENDAGIFMDMETAQAYFTEVAEREAEENPTPIFCRANFLDASALVKLHVVEDGAAIIRAYFHREPTNYTTPFCFYEALNCLKRKWKEKGITKEQYLDAAFCLSAWYGAASRGIKDLDFTLPTTFADAKRIAERWKSLDLSDAFQILSVKTGYYSSLARESAPILVTADKDLAKAAEAEELRVWYFMKEPTP